MADLLKVHLFKLFGSGSWKVAKDRWDEIREILSQVKLNTFLRHYWLSTYDVVQEKDLLREFQIKITTITSADDFLKELRMEAENYEAIINPTIDFWNEIETIELLLDLKLLSAQMPLPLLMAGEKVLDRKDFKRLVKIVISFIMRYVTIGERDNKPLEKLLSDIAIGLRNKSLTSIRFH